MNTWNASQDLSLACHFFKHFGELVVNVKPTPAYEGGWKLDRCDTLHLLQQMSLLEITNPTKSVKGCPSRCQTMAYGSVSAITAC